MDKDAFIRGDGKARKAIEGYWYFLPSLEFPTCHYTPEFVRLLSDADRKLGELSGQGGQLVNPDLLVIPYMRKEAVESSRIEGTQASLSDVFIDEAYATPDRTGDVEEVRNYVRAMEQGLREVKDIPLSMRLLRGLHVTVMTGVRGGTAYPGEVREKQNWIGPPGCTLAQATYVPPHPSHLSELLAQWEKNVHRNDVLPPLLHVAMLHYQFEAIHPFVDGNGRIGRLLMTLYLCAEKQLSQPLLYLSAYFERNRDEYYRRLLAVSQESDWEGWFSFFLRGVREQAEDAVHKTQKILALQAQLRQRLMEDRAPASTMRLLDELFRNPYTTVAGASAKLGVTDPTARAGLERLEQMGIVRVILRMKKRSWYCLTSLRDLLNA